MPPSDISHGQTFIQEPSFPYLSLDKDAFEDKSISALSIKQRQGSRMRTEMGNSVTV